MGDTLIENLRRATRTPGLPETRRWAEWMLPLVETLLEAVDAQRIDLTAVTAWATFVASIDASLPTSGPSPATLSADCAQWARLRVAGPDEIPPEAHTVWQAVSAVARLHHPELHADVRFVSAAARWPDGRHPAPVPLACPGGRIYMPAALVRHIFIERAYPAAFFAFIVGHEVAHLVLHLAGPHGQRLDGRRASRDALDLEVAADVRGAWFAARAGFSLGPIADGRMIRSLLLWDDASRVVLGPSGVDALGTREQRLDALVGDFDRLDDLYRDAMSLMLLGEFDLAERVLAALADGALPLAEVALLRAVSRYQRALGHAPLHEVFAGMGVVVRQPRCRIWVPGRTALGEIPVPDIGLGIGEVQGRKARALSDLDRAEEHLDRAEALGLASEASLTARTCIALARVARPGAALDIARQWAARAVDELAGDSAALGAAQANRALLEVYARWLVEPPPIEPAAPGDLHDWRARWRADVGGGLFAGHAEVDLLARALSRWPVGIPHPPEPAIPCAGLAAPRSLGEPSLPPRLAGERCPSGWSLRHRTVVDGAPTPLRITDCMRGARRVVYLDDLGGRSRTLHVVGHRPPLDVQRFACPPCERVVPAGVLPDGRPSWSWSCGARGLLFGPGHDLPGDSRVGTSVMMW